MKLFKTILEKLEHINRDDLVVFMNAFEQKHTSGEHHCFLKAVVEACKLVDIHVTEKDLYDEFKHLDYDDNGPDVHPDDAKRVLLDKLGISMEYKFLNSADKVKSALRNKLPVIISIRWSDSYYLAARILRDGNKANNAEFDGYRDHGATEEMVKKVKNGIIPYPNERMNKKSTYEATTHAIICVGYDAGDDAFIVRDFNPGSPDYKGFFKIESKLFFDSVLSRDSRLSIIEAAISLKLKIIKQTKQGALNPAPDAVW